MTDTNRWSDEQIHAYVDGELNAALSAKLDADRGIDAALDGRVAAQIQLREQLRAEFSPVAQEAPPRRLLEAIAAPVAPAGVSSLEAARAKRVRWALPEWSAMAASLVLGLVLGPQLIPDSSPTPMEMNQGGLTATGYLDAALSRQAAGTAGDLASIGLSFRARNGEYCRTFDLRSGSTGLACHRAGKWTIELLEGAGAPGSPTPDYRQAGSGLSPAMVATIERLGADGALTPEQERLGLQSGWNGPPDTP